MTVTVVKEGNTLRLIESSEPIPDGTRLRAVLVSEEAYAQWEKVPPESRYTMLLQSTSASFREWLDEDDQWDLTPAGKDPSVSSKP